MSDLSDAIEEISERQRQGLDRAVVVLAENEGVPLDETAGVDIVIARFNDDAIIASVGWGASGIHVDVRAYLEGDRVSAETFELAGTTSVMAVRP